jgi:hypothetical protein
MQIVLLPCGTFQAAKIKPPIAPSNALSFSAAERAWRPPCRPSLRLSSGQSQ